MMHSAGTDRYRDPISEVDISALACIGAVLSSFSCLKQELGKEKVSDAFIVLENRHRDQPRECDV